MERRSFLRNLLGTCAAVSFGKLLKDIGPVDPFFHPDDIIIDKGAGLYETKAAHSAYWGYIQGNADYKYVGSIWPESEPEMKQYTVHLKEYPALPPPDYSVIKS